MKLHLTFLVLLCFLCFHVGFAKPYVSFTHQYVPSLVHFALYCDAEEAPMSLKELGARQSFILKWDQLKADLYEDSVDKEELHSLLLQESIDCKDKIHYIQRLESKLPKAFTEKWKSSLFWFDKSIYQPFYLQRQTAFEDELDSLNGVYKKYEVDRVFQPISAFWGVDDFQQSLRIFLSPNPGSNVLSAILHAKDQEIEQNEFAEIEDYFALIRHAGFTLSNWICEHVATGKENEIQQSFEYSTSVFRIYAYNWLQESVITAFTEGYMYKKLYGVTNTSNWSNQPLVNRYAQVLSAELEDYLNENKEIDEQFIAECLTQFELKFGGCLAETQCVFPFISVYSEKSVDEVQDFITTLESLYDIREMRWNEVLKDISTLKRENSCSIIIIGDEHSPFAQQLRNEYLMFEKDFDAPYFYTLLEGYKPILVLNAQKDLTFLIQKMSINSKLKVHLR